MDAAQLRFAFPALRALEGPLGPLGAGQAGRAALLGQGEPAPPGDDSKRARYVAARDRRLKELQVEKDDEAAKRERRRQRRAGGAGP
jgi:hypothetical protein